MSDEVKEQVPAGSSPVDESVDSAVGCDSQNVKAQYEDQILRLKAEFDNIRKRLERDKQDAVRFANEKMLSELLSLKDDLDRALQSIGSAQDTTKVIQGIELAARQVEKTLKQNGVEVLEAQGKEFDPNCHEALATVESDQYPEGQVADVIQPGYTLHGRLLRPSKVRVYKKNS